MTPLTTGLASGLCPLHAAQLAEACALAITEPTNPTITWAGMPPLLNELRQACAATCQGPRDPYAYSSPLSPYQRDTEAPA